MFYAHEVKKILMTRNARYAGITADRLVREITNAPPTTAALRMLRKRVEELRLAGIPVCGIPTTGYYLSDKEEDINETCEFLHSRAMKSLVQISRMKKRPDPNLRDQLGLPMKEEKWQLT